MHWQRSFGLRLLAIIGVVCIAVAAGSQFGARTARAVDISTDHVLVATLLGAAEVDATGTPGKGDLDGRGSAIIDIEPDSLSICYVLRVTGIATAVAAHIHQGGAATNGPVVVLLMPPAVDGVSSGCTTSTATVITAILARPSNFYVNVHNADFPGGALRGQLGLTTMTTALSGAAEVNAAGEPNQGDLDGSGSAAITVDGSNVCYVLSVASITLPAAAAHIHKARAGTNGPVVVTFTAPNAAGFATGCVEGTIEVINGLRAMPSDYYVNIHTSDFPAGAVRGQLASAAYSINLRGSAEVNATGEPNQGDPDGVGTAGLIVDATRGDICYVLRTSAITLPAAAAHIHRGTAGLNGPVVVTLTAPGANGVASGCATATAPVINEIAATPANFYVNVHTSDFPAGALRGQLAGSIFRTALSGAAEVNAAGEPNQGDTDGVGSAIVTLDAEHGSVCYVLRTAAITLPAAAAHIHRGTAGLNGPVVVPLNAPGADGTASGCATATVDLINEIGATPANFYVNVHTSDFPGGAVRGQLAGTSFRISLSGAAEVNADGAPNQGDTDGTGSAVVTLDAEHDDICFVLRAASITLPAAAAHIHRGTAGLNGPVVVTLTAPGADGTASGCVTATDTLINEIGATPANFYVNVHTSDFPGGAVRGQLAGTTFTTSLSGEQEVNAAGAPNQGDPDGSGSAVVTLDAASGDVCFVLRVKDITLPAAAAHIHRAPAGLNGPVVVALTAPGADGTASGCATATTELINEILNTPANFYVNVHTSDFPGGAVRGQLAGTTIVLPLLGTNEVNAAGEPNQGDPDGAGVAVISLDAAHGDVCYVIRARDITLPAAAAHIHEAPAGLNGPVVVTLTAPGADGTASGCASAASDLITRITASPAGFYVNVHTSDFPAGAVRGQLAGTSIRTALSGAAEVNAAGEPNQGDLDGSGSAIVSLDAVNGDVCFVLRVKDITLPAAAAHIHRGMAGLNGPVVVTLTAPGADGTASGCVTATDTLINEILNAPANFYVNVHTSDFPGGAVRGQLAGTSFRTALSGAAEVNAAGEPNQGDLDGTGSAVVSLDAQKGTVCFVLRTTYITLPAAAAHIHRGTAGLNGPVVVTLTAPGADGTASGCATATTELINEILNTPANFYVNVHTSDFPGGAVRGQLAGTVYRTELNGKQEVNAAGEPNQGDLDGSGSAVVTLDAVSGDVCYVIRVKDITLPAAAAHIHRGSAGQNGPVVVTLTAPGADGTASGCVTATDTLINEILNAPANFYVNVHTSDFPAGAVRGQLAVRRFIVRLPIVTRN